MRRLIARLLDRIFREPEGAALGATGVLWTGEEAA